MVTDPIDIHLPGESLTVAAGMCEGLVDGLPECMRAAHFRCVFNEPSFMYCSRAVKGQWQVVPLQVYVLLLLNPCLQCWCICLAVRTL